MPRPPDHEPPLEIDFSDEDDASLGSVERAGPAAPFAWIRPGMSDPAVAAADWLAEDVAPGCGSALQLVTSATTTIEDLRRAKDAFKAMRVMGEHAADRRLAAWLYLGTIAAAAVHHDRLITSQSSRALGKALAAMAQEERVPEVLRRLAREAQERLGRQQRAE